MGSNEILHGFIFDEHHTLNNHIGREIANYNSIVSDCKRFIALNFEASFEQFMAREF